MQVERMLRSFIRCSSVLSPRQGLATYISASWYINFNRGISRKANDASSWKEVGRVLRTTQDLEQDWDGWRVESHSVEIELQCSSVLIIGFSVSSPLQRKYNTYKSNLKRNGHIDSARFGPARLPNPVDRINTPIR